jgi:uncharacterized protein YbbK (DUF523 family)
MRPILVSACLLGLRTRYDGQGRRHQRVLDYLHQQDLRPVPVCPEQLAGLPTPRPPCSFQTGDGAALLDGHGVLLNADGLRLNDIFLRGALETMLLARLSGCRQALLKERSPSCGVHRVWCGGQLIAGQGVTAALLGRNGLQVISEEDLPGGQE